jgi:hypothetical protein
LVKLRSIHSGKTNPLTANLDRVAIHNAGEAYDWDTTLLQRSNRQADSGTGCYANNDPAIAAQHQKWPRP